VPIKGVEQIDDDGQSADADQEDDGIKEKDHL
jgi:hypothetical protein